MRDLITSLNGKCAAVSGVVNSTDSFHSTPYAPIELSWLQLSFSSIVSIPSEIPPLIPDIMDSAVGRSVIVQTRGQLQPAIIRASSVPLSHSSDFSKTEVSYPWLLCRPPPVWQRIPHYLTTSSFPLPRPVVSPPSLHCTGAVGVGGRGEREKGVDQSW